MHCISTHWNNRESKPDCRQPLKKAAALAAEIHGVKKNALYDGQTDKGMAIS
ncbi:hypothetical protein ACNJN5_22650 [Citrobacter freundii]|uniref:hypothetical protein n=1 Tax=Citrobacter freundii TaxID=546 RepID=UPI003A87F108